MGLLSRPIGESTLRKGKWMPEEEVFANKIIQLFNQGLLMIPIGTTLRSYLSDKLSWYVANPCTCFCMHTK